jgi:hypothetical protein
MENFLSRESGLSGLLSLSRLSRLSRLSGLFGLSESLQEGRKMSAETAKS